MGSPRNVLGCAMFAVLSLSTSVFAQDRPPVIQDGTPVVLTRKPAPRIASGKPSLAGVWSVASTDELKIVTARYGPSDQRGQGNGAPKNEPPSLTPWGAERYGYNQDTRPTGSALEGSGYPTGTIGGRQELNPFFKCVPPGTGYLLNGWGSISPVEIIQSPKRILMFEEYDSTIRQVWTDGRKHPDPVDLTWTGHSIGKWEGDTLVVDTVGLRNEFWLDNQGHVASPGLHIIERYTRLDNDTMQVDFTFDDPKAFQKPWTQRLYKRLRPKWEIVEDLRCYPGSVDQKVNQENFEQLFVEH